VVLHTNLGRAPLAPEAVARVAAVARGYSNLEYDLDEGERGSRYAPVVELLTQLTGAEDALVVNNCAGAALLVLATLAAGRLPLLVLGRVQEERHQVVERMAAGRHESAEVLEALRVRLAAEEQAVAGDDVGFGGVHGSSSHRRGLHSTGADGTGRL